MRLSCAALAALLLWSLPGLTRDYTEPREPCAAHDPLRQPFFGDLHVHTRYSLDASTQGTRTTPAQAYAFARGERVGIQPWSAGGEALRSLQLRRPLDFAAVTDHAELIGEVYMCNTPGVEGHNSWQCLLYRHWSRGAYYLFNYMSSMEASHLGLCGEEDALCLDAARYPWGEMRDAAEQYYDRSSDCAFTSFVGYEWTGVQPDSGGNLHRNIIFRNEKVPELPFSYIDGPAAPLLWAALETQCLESANGCDALVIPHNSNLSAGHMFDGLGYEGGPMTQEYAARRARMEPLVEMFQHKGGSECYYAAGQVEDELCAFEQQPTDNIAIFNTPPQPDTGFVRDALGRGMSLEHRLGANPYRFGFIGSTDTHLGTPGAAAEDDFLGHGGAGTPAGKEVPAGLPDKLEYNPGGLAVVWAEENSRDALFDGMRRRETYATSGPRIVSRFFGGYDLPEDLCAREDRVEVAYRDGVPMGGTLPARGSSKQPAFLLMAGQDVGTASYPGTPLQRLQVIKGSIDANGAYRESVVNVAGTADNGASVDLGTCETSGDGYEQLCAVWTDENFDPGERAYYYARVIENPTCRWSQRMCAAAGVDCERPETIGEGFEGCCSLEHQPVIQERAWTSPIWYTPVAATATLTVDARAAAAPTDEAGLSLESGGAQ